jgi:hypothetical protein
LTRALQKDTTSEMHSNGEGLHIIIIDEIKLSLGGSVPFTNTDKTNKNKYSSVKQYITIHNTENTSKQITKTTIQL